MQKTTVYLPDELKAALTRTAEQRGISEAEVIRTAVKKEVGQTRPRPRGGLFSGGEAIAEHIDEMMKGFGER